MVACGLKRRVFTVAMGAVFGFSAGCSWLFSEKDLGGTLVDLEFDLSSDAHNTKTSEVVARVLEARMRALGTTRGRASAIGAGGASVYVPAQIPSDAITELFKTYALEFYEVDEEAAKQEIERCWTLAQASGSLEVEPCNLPPDRKLLREESGASGELYAVKTPAAITGSSVKSADINMGEQNNMSQVNLVFTEDGGRIFEGLTRRLVGKRLAIVLDDRVVSAPTIREPIPGGRSVIDMGGAGGSETVYTQAKMLAAALNSQSLPVAIRVTSMAEVKPGELSFD